MDKRYSWKRTEETEIDLIDLLCRICRKWKQMTVCALVSALVLGGYGWIKGSAVSEEVLETELTEEEERVVMAAVQLENENRSLKEYLDSSVLMQIDPYHKNKFVMLYSIDGAKRQELPKIIESYLSYIVNGGAADALKKSGSSVWKIDKSLLAELMTAYQKIHSSSYQLLVEDAADSSMLSEALFYVEVTGKSAEQAKQMAMDLQRILRKYSNEIKESAGSHKLTLINEVASVTADSGLQAQQHDKKELWLSNRSSLIAMRTAFSKEQTALYKEGVGEEDEPEEEEPEEMADTDRFRSVIKYIVLGLTGGIFVYGAFFSCCYIFSDMVKSTEEIKTLYTFPFYGGIFVRNNNTKIFGPAWNEHECSNVQMMNRIRLACKKQGITQLCAASDFAFEQKEKDFLESIAKQLESRGIHMTIAENVLEDTAVWDELIETGNVLLVCRTGTTTHRMIDDLMNFYFDNSINVAGAAAFIQN